MEFYTSVARYGNNLLYRGVKDGLRVKTKIPFKPTLYVPSNKNETRWTGLDGTNVEPITFGNMKEWVTLQRGTMVLRTSRSSEPPTMLHNISQTNFP